MSTSKRVVRLTLLLAVLATGQEPKPKQWWSSPPASKSLGPLVFNDCNSGSLRGQIYQTAVTLIRAGRTPKVKGEGAEYPVLRIKDGR
jgi:hypothetical protein